jgi:hypothetical protein
MKSYRIPDTVPIPLKLLIRITVVTGFSRVNNIHHVHDDFMRSNNEELGRGLRLRPGEVVSGERFCSRAIESTLAVGLLENELQEKQGLIINDPDLESAVRAVDSGIQRVQGH